MFLHTQQGKQPVVHRETGTKHPAIHAQHSHSRITMVKEEWKEVRQGEGMKKVGNRSQEIQCREFRSHCTMDQVENQCT